MNEIICSEDLSRLALAFNSWVLLTKGRYYRGESDYLEWIAFLNGQRLHYLAG
jgi:hypothetical protein